MPKPLSKRQQMFFEIGHAFETPNAERFDGMNTSCGICWAINCYNPDDRLDDFVGAFILAFKPKFINILLYWWPTYINETNWSRDCDFERATFCYFMAALTDKEYDEMVACV